MTGFEIATLAIAAGQLAVGAAAVGAILYGIRQMGHAGDQREKREDARHAESMTALRALVQGLERQGEALQRQGEALERQGAVLEAALKGRT
ncbi:MAG: hypothetical protein OXI64_04690 [Defluviicoccus sp.]|nr:hypothetical protein [Defluviicoccus sp.]